MRRILVVLCIALFTLWYFPTSQAEEASAEQEGKEFTLKEKLWAAKWISEKLALLMEDGLIKKIKCYEDDSNYEVFVSSSWHLLSTEEKGDFLRDLSRAREITQHSPYLVVKDSESEEMVARVDEWGILVFGKGGEREGEDEEREQRERGEKLLSPMPQEDSYIGDGPNTMR